MLRAIFVVVIILYGLWMSFRGPFYALLFYLWIAYFRPENWLWSDWFSQLNLSLIIGVVVLVSTLLSQRRIRFGIGPCLMLLLAAQSLVSTFLSPAFAFSWPYCLDFVKSTVICVLLGSLVEDERELRLVFLVIGFSLGLETVKQGWAQMILNPGAQNDNSIAMLGDNNGVAVGVFMLVAIFVALARTTSLRGEKLAHRFAIVGLIYRGLSTFSRGGFLACGALGIQYLMRARHKFAATIGVALVCLLIVPILSDAYWERMNTITAASEDAESVNETSEGRIHFWQVAVQMANANALTGVGHNAYSLFYDQYDTTQGDYGEGRAVHSSWFGVLAELGYPGFLLFVAILIHAFWTCRRAQRLAKKNPDFRNLALYAGAIEGALVTFAVGGTFVAFQYVELLWHTFALSIVVERLIAERLAAKATAPAKAPVPEPVRVRVGGAISPPRPIRI